MRTSYTATALLCILFWAGCTHNPFDDDHATLGRRQIRGSVTLSDGLPAEGVLVWLESADLGTSVKNGEFVLTLPARLTINPEDSFGGTLRLYFYIANYGLEVRQVVVQNGEFVYSVLDLDDSGRLNETVVLDKFLEIESTISPDLAALSEADSTDSLVVHVQTRALGDTVSVQFPYTCKNELCPDHQLGAIFLREVATEQAFVIAYAPPPCVDPPLGAPVCPVEPEFTDVDRVLSRELLRTQNSRSMAFTLHNSGLRPGEYEIIPFLLVAHQAIPEDLLNYFGIDFRRLRKTTEPDLEYLKIPFRRTNARLTISD